MQCPPLATFFLAPSGAGIPHRLMGPMIPRYLKTYLTLRGAHASAALNDGRRPLHLAAEAKHSAIVTDLVELRRVQHVALRHKFARKMII